MRLLTPPSTSDRSVLRPFNVTKSRAIRIVETQQKLEKDHSISPEDRLAAQLQGPCSNLRLVNIEARVKLSSSAEEAKQWAEDLMQAAYSNVKPYKKLKVLINPIGGTGKAMTLFPTRIRPVLEAAGCTLDVEVTKYVHHGLEIARKLSLEEKWDAIVCISGDGMLHEVLNGLAQREDAVEALQIPVAPIPTGSGNALAVNLLGATQGFNLALACLNVIKGRPMPLDVCSITRPSDSATSAEVKVKSSANHKSAAVPSDSTAVTKLPYDLHYSFISQAIGLMADVDLGTEDMRSLGETRFVIGYIGGMITNRECEADVFVKLGDKGTLDKEVMRERLLSCNNGTSSPSIGQNGSAQTKSVSNLHNGPVTDPLPEADTIPMLNIQDKSWPSPLVDTILDDNAKKQINQADQWYRFPAPISALYAGKIPYVARDVLQFPLSLPGDGCVDVALALHEGGRKAALRTLGVAEKGGIPYDAAVVYMKVQAYRVVPRLAAGHKRLKRGGLISIDGEHWPYKSFQVEVNPSVQLRVLSLYGKWSVPLPSTSKVS